MTENEKSKVDGLLRWLIIDTILSLCIILVLGYSFFPRDYFDFLGIFMVYGFFQIVIWIGTITTSWYLWKKGMRKMSLILSLISLGISFVLPLLMYLY